MESESTMYGMKGAAAAEAGQRTRPNQPGTPAMNSAIANVSGRMLNNVVKYFKADANLPLKVNRELFTRPPMDVRVIGDEVVVKMDVERGGLAHGYDLTSYGKNIFGAVAEEFEARGLVRGDPPEYVRPGIWGVKFKIPNVYLKLAWRSIEPVEAGIARSARRVAAEVAKNLRYVRFHETADGFSVTFKNPALVEPNLYLAQLWEHRAVRDAVQIVDVNPEAVAKGPVPVRYTFKTPTLPSR